MRDSCNTCGHVFTKKELAKRRAERIQNAMNSQKKAKERGNPFQRKRSFNYSEAKKFIEDGWKPKDLALMYGVNLSTIYKAVKAETK